MCVACLADTQRSGKHVWPLADTFGREPPGTAKEEATRFRELSQGHMPVSTEGGCQAEGYYTRFREAARLGTSSLSCHRRQVIASVPVPPPSLLQNGCTTTGSKQVTCEGGGKVGNGWCLDQTECLSLQMSTCREHLEGVLPLYLLLHCCLQGLPTHRHESNEQRNLFPTIAS